MDKNKFDLAAATTKYEELLAGGSHADILAHVAVCTKRVDSLFAEAKKRADKANTQEELDEITTLDTHIEELQTKAAEIKKFDDIKAKNSKRLSDMNTPNRKVPFNNGGEPPADDGPVTTPIYAGTLKHFRGETAQKAATAAHRFGMFLKGWVLNPNPGIGKAADWCRENGIEVKVQQSEGVIQDGGAIVPEEFERTLIDLREEYGVFRPNAKTEPMKAETKLIPRRTGGLTAYFVGEGAAGTQSTKAWDVVELVTKKLMCLVPYTTELSEDAIINLADDLAGEIAYAFALKEDNCGFMGDGTSTYGGITGVINKLLGLNSTIANIAGIRVQATVSTGTFASAILGDFEGTIAKLPKYADTPRAKWYMHKTFYHSVPATLMAAAGGNNISSLQDGARKPMFLGYPVEFAQVMPSVWVANQIFALFGDLSLAASFGDRRATTLFTDPYSLSANDQIQIRGTERFDIVVHDVGNASATANLRVPGPIVAFASAAS